MRETRNLVYESNKTKIVTSIVSTQERINGIDSLQSSYACFISDGDIICVRRFVFSEIGIELWILYNIMAEVTINSGKTMIIYKILPQYFVVIK